MDFKQLIIIIIWLLTSCSGFKKALKFDSALSRGTINLKIAENITDSIQIYYSGCSGFYFKMGNRGLLHDPFISNNGPLLKLNTSKLKVNAPLITKYFEKIISKNIDNEGNIKGILASHTHYDHVLDFPEIIGKHLNIDSTTIGGNVDLKTILKLSKISTLNYKDLGVLASDSASFNGWVYLKNNSIRVLPILSDHAPHYYGIKFYGGNIDSTRKIMPNRAADFKQGQSLSYLIDFLNGNNSQFRIYIQGSASEAPSGFPPKLDDNKNIDLAILCVASYKYIEDYPEKILEYLKPRHVILAHWENFFLARNQLYQTPAQVPFTDVAVFLKRYQKKAKELNIKGFTMPISDTFINLHF